MAQHDANWEQWHGTHAAEQVDNPHGGPLWLRAAHGFTHRHH
jgi:hypothetical protein